MLPTHTGRRTGPAIPSLRPDFERLFTNFRISKTHFSYTDPTTGEEARRPVVRCSKCHIESGEFEPTTGASIAENLVSRVRSLTAHTAQAERVLLRARRGGVGKMPGAKGRLTEDRIAAVARYTLRFLEPEKE